jgi:hypothetical protein
MAYICLNCDQIFAHSGKYCSERCERQAHKHRRQILLASVVGLLAAMFANYTAPGEGWFSEPNQFLTASKLHELAAVDTCTNGIAKIKSMAKPALPEKLFTWTPTTTAIAIAQKVGSYVGLVQAPENCEKN